MKKIITCLFVLFLIFVGAHAIYAQTVYKNSIDGKIWIKLTDDYGSEHSLIQNNNRKNNSNSESINKSSSHGRANSFAHIPLEEFPFIAEIAEKYHISNLSKPFFAATNSTDLQLTYQINFKDKEAVDALIEELQSSGKVDYAEKIPLNTTFAAPNDPQYSNQWFLPKIKAEQAWNYSTGNSNIVVAVVDNAIDINHKDLKAAIWTNPNEIPGNRIDDDGNGYVDDVHGYDVADNNNDPTPPNNKFDHGTHCAGLVGALTNNNRGIASIGNGVSIMAVKVTKDTADDSKINNGYEGIVYAAKSGANVISCSWGSTHKSSTGQNIVDYAWGEGAIVIVAAGNDDNSVKHYPAAYNHVFAVAASDENDKRASFSCYGSWVDISAPGTHILSTIPGSGNDKYAYMQGTSMACPIVSGLAGLIWSFAPGMSQNDLLQCISGSSDNIDSKNLSYKNQLGAGRINAKAAMDCASQFLKKKPVADFTANHTKIVQGGKVNFTDLSYYSPSSWKWTFQGGSPSSSTSENPKNIEYNSSGTYTVTLKVSNSNGSSTKTKSKYIEVSSSTGCDMITEIKKNDKRFSITLGTKEYVGGANSYNITKWAAKFPSTMYGGNNYVQNAQIIFSKATSTQSKTDSVDFYIWSDNAGKPGSKIPDSKVTVPISQIINDVQKGDTTQIEFKKPIKVTGDFYLGYDYSSLNYSNLAILSTQDIYNQSGRNNKSSYFYFSTAFSGHTDWEYYSNFFANSTTKNPENRAYYIFVNVTKIPVTAKILPNNVSFCQDSILEMDGTGSTNAFNYKWEYSGSSMSSNSKKSKPQIQFDKSGNHIVKLTAYNSCGAYSTTTTKIDVKESPNVSITSTNNELCVGSSIQLSAHGAQSYIWNNGLPNGAGPHTVSPTNSTTYTVVGTGSNGCSDVASVKIVVNPKAPIASISYNPTKNICINDLVSFISTGSSNANTYNWTFDGGTPSSSSSSNPSIKFSTAGKHQYKLEVKNSCGTNSKVGKIEIEDCTSPNSISKNDKHKLIDVYYNDNSRNVVMNIENIPKGNYNLVVLNSIGKAIINKDISIRSKQQLKYNMSHYSDGIYFIKLIGTHEQFIKKFVKY